MADATPSFTIAVDEHRAPADQDVVQQGLRDFKWRWLYVARLWLPFYQKLGYELYGTLEGYPPGYRQYYLRKVRPTGSISA